MRKRTVPSQLLPRLNCVATPASFDFLWFWEWCLGRQGVLLRNSSMFFLLSGRTLSYFPDNSEVRPRSLCTRPFTGRCTPRTSLGKVYRLCVCVCVYGCVCACVLRLRRPKRLSSCPHSWRSASLRRRVEGALPRSTRIVSTSFSQRRPSRLVGSVHARAACAVRPSVRPPEGVVSASRAFAAFSHPVVSFLFVFSFFSLPFLFVRHSPINAAGRWNRRQPGPLTQGHAVL